MPEVRETEGKGRRTQSEAMLQVAGVERLLRPAPITFRATTYDRCMNQKEIEQCVLARAEALPREALGGPKDDRGARKDAPMNVNMLEIEGPLCF
jgi:hypothetical protein